MQNTSNFKTYNFNFLLYFSLCNNTGDDDVHAIDDRVLIGMGADIVTVGQLTTSTSIQTLIALMANYQSIQERAYKEIQQVIGV